MLTSDELLAAVRVHADRVHDAARRLGCGPEAAIRVTHGSALDLVDAVAHRPAEVTDPVGWWFARARSLARRATGGDDALPQGGGVLGVDENQVRLAAALEARPERERAALLLRDSYDLPPSTVATVLGLDVESATQVVAQARLAFLPALASLPPLPASDHPPALTALARVAEGGQLAAREGTARRHAQACPACAAVVDVQERARRLLSGLSVVALPDDAREALLTSVEGRAIALLPAAEPAEDDWEDEPGRGYSLSLMALGLVLATGLGGGIGALASRGGDTGPLTAQRELPLVTAAPVITVGPLRTPSSSPTPSPSPRVFQVTPSPTPTPSPTASPTPTATQSTTEVVLDPAAGPPGTQITVTGQGWTPGAAIVVQFHSAFGDQPGTTAEAIADQDGFFTTTLTAQDNQGTTIGPHTVSADDGTHHAEATFTVTG
ncbi:MAG TPA: hypothetical protein VM097_07710 [Mycobacteriales bacterium]|nr:hypothetical protein [Mycobacteriales bacterium]